MPFLQWGDVGTAGAEKYNLEEMQRAERKVREDCVPCVQCAPEYTEVTVYQSRLFNCC